MASIAAPWLKASPTIKVEVEGRVLSEVLQSTKGFGYNTVMYSILDCRGIMHVCTYGSRYI